MERLLNILVAIVLLLFVSNCASTNKSKVKHQAQIIKLHNLESDNWLQINNEYITIYFDLSDVIGILENDSLDKSNIELLEYIGNDNVSFNLLNNLKLESQYEAAVFPIVWNLLKNGNARVYNKKTDSFVNEIEFVRIKYISGEQEYFMLIKGDIFLSKTITIGE